jgi:hypothetical protein
MNLLYGVLGSQPLGDIPVLQVTEDILGIHILWQLGYQEGAAMPEGR